MAETMQLPLYDYLRANPQAFAGAGFGQAMGEGNPGTEDFSRNAYGLTTGDWANSGPDSPAYKAWALSKVPQNWKDDMMAAADPKYKNIASMLPDGRINVPGSIRHETLDDSGFLGISNDFWKPAGVLSLIGGAGALFGSGGLPTGAFELGTGNLGSNAMSMMGSAGPMSTTSGLLEGAGAGFWGPGGGAGFTAGTGAGVGFGDEWFKKLLEGYNPDMGFEGPGGEAGSMVPVEERSRQFISKGAFDLPEVGNLATRMTGSPSIGDFVSNIFGSGAVKGPAAAGSLPWNMISGGMNIGSGIYGMMRKRNLDKLAGEAFGRYNERGDPYGPARTLMANPGSITGMPGYQFGMDEGRRAIARQGAASGSGGNEAIAAARYTPEYAQNFYNSEVARLMALGNGEASIGGNNAMLGLNASKMGNDLASSSLGSIGYGVSRMADPFQNLLKRMLRG